MSHDITAPRQHTWVARDFRFHTGQVLPELKLHVTTLGHPQGEPVLLLHGTNGSGSALLAPEFGGQLFRPGQVLDAREHFLILPDGLGCGRSSKPSDGLRTAFPRYNYDDMVQAQHRLLTEGLGVSHLHAIIGNSMGGMHTWLWAQQHPGFMDVAVPMACQPAPMSGRNWMLRRMIIDAIRHDPAWQGGHYTAPLRSAQVASVFYGLATNGGHQALHAAAPTREAADAFLDARLAAPQPLDANDLLYQWEASRHYDPTPGLGRITARVLAINSADDERNPPELGVMAPALARVPGAREFLIPASVHTTGHGTVGQARWWKDELAKVLGDAPRLG